MQFFMKLAVCSTVLGLTFFYRGVTSRRLAKRTTSYNDQTLTMAPFTVVDQCSVHPSCEACLSAGCRFTTTPHRTPVCVSHVLELDFEPRILRRQAEVAEASKGCPQQDTTLQPKRSDGVFLPFGVMRDFPQLSLSSSSSQKSLSPSDSKDVRECSQTLLLLLTVGQFLLIVLQLLIVLALWKLICLKMAPAEGTVPSSSTSSSDTEKTREDVNVGGSNCV